MHLKDRLNPDMVFTGQPQLLARLVWDGDFRNPLGFAIKTHQDLGQRFYQQHCCGFSHTDVTAGRIKTSLMTPSVFPNHSEDVSIKCYLAACIRINFVLGNQRERRLKYWNLFADQVQDPPVIGFADCPANTSLWKHQAPRRKAGAALPPTQKCSWESQVAQTVLMETACCRATCEVRDLVLHVYFAHSEGNAVPIPREARKSVQALELHFIMEVNFF